MIIQLIKYFIVFMIGDFVGIALMCLMIMAKDGEE